MIKKMFLIVIMSIGVGDLSYSAVTPLLNYQGRLTDSGGSPLTGSYNILFSIYNVPTGGSALWSETQTVSVSEGLFSVSLGSFTALNLPFDADYWLGIKVGADAEMTPRQRLTAAGYSIRSGTAAYVVNAVNSIGKYGDTTILQGNVKLEEGTNITITRVDANNSLKINASGGTGDMLKATYDTNANNIVDNSEKLNGKTYDAFVSTSGGTMSDRLAININTSGLPYAGLYVNSDCPSCTDAGVMVHHNSSNAGIALFIDNEGTGRTAKLRARGNNNSYVLEARQDNSAASSEVVYIRNSGTGTSLEIYNVNTNNYAIHTYGNDCYFEGGHSDVAEYFPGLNDIEAGDVVVIDPSLKINLKKSDKEYDSLVAGVISTQPMFQYGSPENDITDKSKQKGVLLTVAGRVPCKVDASYGEIKIGDLLTTSPTPGHAMKAINPKIGTIVGKALEPLKEGKGKIMILVTLQ